MLVFRVARQVFDKFPNAVFGVVAAKGINNVSENPRISQLLEAQTKAARDSLDGKNLREHPMIAPYREAFAALGYNPNKFMCSVEALCKRVMKGSALPKINPVVDLGNAMSMKYTLPIGAHDIRKLSGDLEVRFAEEGDTFLPIGETERESPDSGELVYVSGRTVKTRRWIWRQSDDGKIDGTSVDVVFPIDGFLDRNCENVIKARDELASLLKEFFGCEVSAGNVTRDNQTFSLE